MPDPGPGELLIEVHAAGICGTDASEWSHGPTMFPISRRNPQSGHLGPMVPGHEFGGRVVARGPDVAGFPDAAVVASGAGISCGQCPACTRMLTNFCEQYFTVGLQRNGALAQYVTVPASICLPVEEHGLGDDGAALVQPMSVAHHALRQGSPQPGDTVVVIGIGGVGAFLVFAAAEMGMRVVAADLAAERLQIAGALGAHRTVEVDRDEDLASQLRDPLEAPAEVIYEVTGVDQALQAALAAVAPRAGWWPSASAPSRFRSTSARSRCERCRSSEPTPMCSPRTSRRRPGLWGAARAGGATWRRWPCRWKLRGQWAAADGRRPGRADQDAHRSVDSGGCVPPAGGPANSLARELSSEH